MLPTILWRISPGNFFFSMMVLNRQPKGPYKPNWFIVIFLHHLVQPCGPSPICYDHMFEGWPPKPKGMYFHLVIENFNFLIMEIIGHGIMGRFGGKSGLGLSSCPLDLFWGVKL